MSSLAFSYIFAGFLVANLALRFWLATRQIHHVTTNRSVVPTEFASKISLPAHQTAADYTVARQRFNMVSHAVDACVVLIFTLFGGLQWLSDSIHRITGGGMPYQLGILGAFGLITALIGLPFDAWRQFVLEARFGFNRMTPTLFLRDFFTTLAISMVLGGLLLTAILMLMHHAGGWWWAWGWGVFCLFQLVMQLAYPNYIAPLFNRFEPLEDGPVRQRVENLMRQTGFHPDGLFVMDGSRRSAHGNAYFSGIGKQKRIVFYDTLLKRLDSKEIEAVMAHELGHFKLHHIRRTIVVALGVALAGFALLGWLRGQAWFYDGLGVDPISLHNPQDANAMALLLFSVALPVFLFIFSPIRALLSRRHEFQADAFAARQTDPAWLISALVKLYEDNASTLTPDPLHSTFYDSHPPATLRIRHLQTITMKASNGSA